MRIDPNSYHSDEGPTRNPDNNKPPGGLRGILSSKSQPSTSSSSQNTPQMRTKENKTSADRISQNSSDDVQKVETDRAEELRKAAGRGDLGKIQTILGKPGNSASVALVNQLDKVSEDFMFFYTISHYIWSECV